MVVLKDIGIHLIRPDGSRFREHAEKIRLSAHLAWTYVESKAGERFLIRVIPAQGFSYDPSEAIVQSHLREIGRHFDPPSHPPFGLKITVHIDGVEVTSTLISFDPSHHLWDDRTGPVRTLRSGLTGGDRGDKKASWVFKETGGIDLLLSALNIHGDDSGEGINNDLDKCSTDQSSKAGVIEVKLHRVKLGSKLDSASGASEELTYELYSEPTWARVKYYYRDQGESWVRVQLYVSRH